MLYCYLIRTCVDVRQPVLRYSRAGCVMLTLYLFELVCGKCVACILRQYQQRTCHSVGGSTSNSLSIRGGVMPARLSFALRLF